MSINVVMLVGHAGRDPELRFLDSGSCVCEFTLAIKRPARDGQPQDPLWVRCKAWGKTAQVAGDYLRKGNKVAIIGRLEQEQWSDRRTGEVRTKMLVVIDRLELCSGRQGEDTIHRAADAPADTRAVDPKPLGSDWSSTPAGGTPLRDEEVPF